MREYDTPASSAICCSRALGSRYLLSGVPRVCTRAALGVGLRVMALPKVPEIDGRTQALLARAYRGTSAGPLVDRYELRDELFNTSGPWLSPAGDSETGTEVPLEGQEFLRFAACESPDDLADFCRAFGDGAVWSTAKAIRRNGDAPLVLALCSQTAAALRYMDGDPQDAYAPIGDLWRLSRLMRAVVHAYEASTDPKKLASQARRLPDDPLKFDPKSVIGRPFLEPLADAGLTLWRDAGTVAFAFPRRLGGVLRPHRRLSDPRTGKPGISRASLLGFIAETLNPVLRLVHSRAVIGDRGLLNVHEVEAGRLLPILFVQAAVTFEAQLVVKACKWARCLGAPRRASLFLFRSNLAGDPVDGGWRWRPARQGRPRGQDYCSPQCATAASSAMQRKGGRT